MKGYNKYALRSILRRWLEIEGDGIFEDARFQYLSEEIEKLKNTNRNFFERYELMKNIQKDINGGIWKDIKDIREEMFLEKEDDDNSIPI